MSNIQTSYEFGFSITGLEQLKEANDSIGNLVQVSSGAKSLFGQLGESVSQQAAETKEAATANSELESSLNRIVAALETQIAIMRESGETLAQSAQKQEELKGKMDDVSTTLGEVSKNTKQVTEEFHENQTEVGNLQQTLTLARRAWQQFSAAIEMFNPIMAEATRLMDIAAKTGRATAEIVLLEKAMNNLGVASIEAFESLRPELQNAALDDAREAVGKYAETMQRLSPTLVDAQRSMDEAKQTIQAGFAMALSSLAPIIKNVSALLSKVPLKVVAAALLAITGIMTGSAIGSIVRVTAALRTHAAAWANSTKQVIANTVALRQNSAAAAANTKASAGAGAAGFMGGKGTVAMIGGIGALTLSERLGEEDGKKGAAGKLLGVGGYGAMGAGAGAMMTKTWHGAAAGAILGTAYGVYEEFVDDIHAAVAPEDFKRKQDKKTLATAQTKAKGPLEELEKNIEEFYENRAKSFADRDSQNRIDLNGISYAYEGVGDTSPEEILKLLSQKKEELEKLLSDPAKALGAAKELEGLSENMREFQKLAAERERLDEEGKQRTQEQKKSEFDLFQSKQELELQYFLSQKKSATEIAEFRREQLKKHHAEAAKLDTPENSEINKNLREAERLRLERELEENPGKIRDKNFNPNGPGASDSMTRIGLLAAAPAQSFDYSHLRSIRTDLSSLPEKIAKALRANPAPATGTMWN